MYQWMSDNLCWENALLGAGLFILSSVGGLAVAAFILARLPANYFQDNHHPAAFAWLDRHPFFRWCFLIGKNLLGLALIMVGIALSLPGIPGPGFLTILIGFLLLNFPRKRRLERWFVSRPSIRDGINRLRARFGKPPLDLNGIDSSASEDTPTSGGSRPPLARSRTTPC